MEKPINQIVTEIRKKAKLSRKGLEVISGFKERTVIAYERGENPIPQKYIEFISLYFNCYEENLLKGECIEIDKALRVLLMYQSIFDYDDKKMQKLIKPVALDYVIFKKDLQLSLQTTPYKKEEWLFEIAEALNIKPSLLDGSLELTKQYLRLNRSIEEEEKKEILKALSKRELKAEENGFNITPAYYAENVKKKNEHKNMNILPEKHRKVVELLPYATDNFIDTLIEKLEIIKKAQQF